MALNSSDASATPVSIICSVCVESLTSDGSDLVTTNCGHAFHKRCLIDWYNSYNNGKKKSQRRYICPKCNKITKSDCTRDLHLCTEDDIEYLAVVKTMERFRQEKTETIEKLSQKESEMIRLRRENDETVDCLRQEKAEAMERLSQKDAEMVRLRQENVETVNHLRQKHSKEMKRLHLVNAETADHLSRKNVEIVTLRQVHSEQMERLRQEHDATVGRLDREKAEQIERLRQENVKSVERLHQDFSDQMERHRQKNAETVATLCQEKAEAIERLSQKDVEMVRLRQEHSKEMERLRQKNAETVARLCQEKAEAIERLSQKDVEMVRLRQEHSKEMERLHLENAKTADHLHQKDIEIVTLRQVHSEQMERLRQENVESVERLQQDYSEQMERLCQKHSETVARLHQEHQETIERLNQNLIIANGSKSILLEPNKNVLDEQLGQLKWDDLSLSVQNDLWKKVPPRCHLLEFNKSVSFRSNTLIRLMNSGPNDEELLLNLIEDYFYQQRKLNGRVTWNDFTKLFKPDLLPWLREKCEHPSLELDELPLTPKIIVALMKAEEDETKRGVTLVARIVELSVENVSVQINDICRRVCKRLIGTVVPRKLEFSPCLVDPVERLWMLRNDCEYCGTERFLTHNSVISYFAAMVMRRTFPPEYQEPDFIEHSAGHWPTYFLKYFYNAPSDFALKLINLRDVITRDLVTIYSLMSPEKIIFQYFMANQSLDYRKHLLNIQWPFKIKSFLVNLTLVHLAVLKGDYHKVQFLLHNMNFAQVLDQSRFQDLVQICVLETSDQSDEQIEERKKIIETVLKYSKNMAAKANPIICLTNVHIDLLKFLVERGPEVHQEIWSNKQMLLEAAEYLEPDQFHDLAEWLVENGHLEMLKKRDAEGASPLDLAIRRINVKPETIQLFRHAGDSEEEGESEEEKLKSGEDR